MITRIVKLHFQTDFCASFEDKYPAFKKIVTSFPGCRGVKLQKSTKGGIYFTISEWEEESNLEEYRNSEAFKLIWNQLKPYFAERAEAWTTANVF